jgi:hypothetical protein
MRSFKVEWQRVFPSGSFETISSCEHVDLRRHDAEEEEDPEGCNPDFNSEDFSLVVRNFTELRGKEWKVGVRFKCLVAQFDQPTSSVYAMQIRDVDTFVRFYAAVVTRALPPYTVTQPRERLTLQIEFSGQPLRPVQWELNGAPLPRSFSDDTATTSSLSLGPDIVQRGDIVRATVSVLDRSSASTETRIVTLRKSARGHSPSIVMGRPVCELKVCAHSYPLR